MRNKSESHRVRTEPRSPACHKFGMNSPIKNPHFQNPNQVQFKRPAQPLPQEKRVEVQTQPQGAVDARAGSNVKVIGQPRPQFRTLGERRGGGSRSSSRRSSVQEKNGSSLGLFFGPEDEEEEDSFPYRQAARSMVDSLLKDGSRKGRQEIEDALSKAYQPLEEFTVLFGAMKEVDKREDKTPKEKKALKNALNEMMTTLVNRERSGVRKGLREGAEVSPVAAAFEAAQRARGYSETLREIRFKVGARANSGVDEELTPLMVVKALLKNFGAAYAEEALESICSRLMAALRVFSRIKATAYNLTVSDAVVFSIVRTGFKTARDLKRNMVAKADVLSMLHPVEIAVVLFSASELGWGKGKGFQAVNQIADMKHVTPLTRAKVFTVVRDAIDMLPVTAWPAEKLPARKDLLEDLDRLVFEAHAEIPPLTTKEERREEEWRNMFAEGRAPTEPARKEQRASQEGGDAEPAAQTAVPSPQPARA